MANRQYDMHRLVLQHRLNRDELEFLMRMLRVGGAPPADGFDSTGNPQWNTRSVLDFARAAGAVSTRLGMPHSTRPM